MTQWHCGLTANNNNNDNDNTVKCPGNYFQNQIVQVYPKIIILFSESNISKTCE